MCECTPNKRTPCCENCPHELQVKWGLAHGKVSVNFEGQEQKSLHPLDKIIEALTVIAEAMDEGGIDQFDLKVGELFKFSGRKKV